MTAPRFACFVSTLALAGSAAVAMAQQPVAAAQTGPADSAPASTGSERILWDQLDPKYRRAKSERELNRPSSKSAPDRAPAGTITLDKEKLPPGITIKPGTTVIIGPPTR